VKAAHALISRRSVLAGAALVAASPTTWSAAPRSPPDKLVPLTPPGQPIAPEEHRQRIGKLQSLLQQARVGALLVEAGTSLQYFTGIQWRRSERTTAAVIPATGQTVVVTPYFEAPSVSESLKVPADVRTWHEDADPFQLLAAALQTRGAESADGRTLAIESTTRYFIVEAVTRAAGSALKVVSADPFVRACRIRKSAAERALMQSANNITLAAIRHAHSHIKAGMSASDISALLTEATAQLGGQPGFALVLLNEASAYPHGSSKPQTVHEGSTILIDAGCSLYGYESDISRTWVYGAPTARQREVWETVRHGQDVALQAARPGVPAGDVDRAVRAYYEQRGWTKDYGLPGLSHRTGHGIGMDGHEPPYLVRSDRTPLEPGMCFSDEPGLYIPGEFGIRLEDCWYMTDGGPKLFTELAKSIDQPV
jgi:Xaa-Pro dipeptidase